MILHFFLFLADVFIGFSSSTYIATESEEQVTVCVKVLNSEPGGALRPFSVSILPEEGIFHSITKYSSTLYIRTDEVSQHHAHTFEKSDLNFQFQFEISSVTTGW